MAYSNVVTRPDGSLYCDISVESLGFPQYTPLMSLPIMYDSAKFKEMGELFVGYARSTCPVDTGYLRDHNDYSSDAGGIEMWSEAFYSAYQEYGTSRCRAQPWFESSIQSALVDSGIEDDFKTTETRYAYVDGLLSTLSTMEFYTLVDAQEGLRICGELRKEFGLLGIDDSDGGMIDQITKEIADRIDMMYIQMQQMQKTGFSDLSWLEQMIIQIIAGMFGALVRMLIDNIFGGEHKTDANPHNPTH